MPLAYFGKYIGDFDEDSIIVIPFDTSTRAGDRLTRTVKGIIKVYKNDSTVEKTTLNGITDSNDFDSNIGINVVTVDTSNDTGDIGFWAPGNDYLVILVDSQIDGGNVNRVIGHFSIKNRLTANIFEDTNETQSKLPAGTIASEADVQGIQNNTRFVASIPSYFLIPTADSNIYEMKIHFYDNSGNMEDPNFDEFSIKARTADGTSKNALLFKEYALTNPLDASTIFPGFLALERITNGIYHCYIQIASTETDTQFLYDFACEEGEYIVTFVEGANGTITGQKIQGIDANQDTDPVTAVPNTGYHFVDWTGDVVSSDNPLIVTNVTEDKTTTANFEINEYDVTFIEGADGTITGDKNQVIEYGSDCTTVEAVPDNGFLFDGWTGDVVSSDNPLTVTNVINDLNITANFVSADINIFTFNNSQQQNNNNE